MQKVDTLKTHDPDNPIIPVRYKIVQKGACIQFFLELNFYACKEVYFLSLESGVRWSQRLPRKWRVRMAARRIQGQSLWEYTRS